MKDTKGNTWVKQISRTGEFKRRDSQFRNWIGADPASEFPAVAGRYHLYVSLACPWAHRTLIVRSLKGLEHAITVDVVDHLLTSRGWTFTEASPGSTKDTVNGYTELRQAYLKVDPDYAGAVTVPVLWDKQSSRLVNNESSEIIRMFNTEMQAFAENPQLDLYPEPLREAIDAVNDWVYPQINNGVYRCGFARSQSAYDTAFGELFEGLDRAEGLLSKSRYLTGDTLTEADIRLFTTLVRFDAVYLTHFKCNKRRLTEYPNLWGFTRDLYQMPAIRKTVDMFHIKHHYFESHESVNPHRIVPGGPEIDFDQPHGRG